MENCQAIKINNNCLKENNSKYNIIAINNKIVLNSNNKKKLIIQLICISIKITIISIL